MATAPFVLGRGRVLKSLAVSIVLRFGTSIRKDLVVEKGTIPAEKVPLPMDPPAWQETQVDFP